MHGKNETNIYYFNIFKISLSLSYILIPPRPPKKKKKIYFMHKTSTCGGVLDVDRMQDCSDPVENIVWKNKVLKIDFFLILCAHTFQRKKNQKKNQIYVYIFTCASCYLFHQLVSNIKLLSHKLFLLLLPSYFSSSSSR
jgi:hypothetical protein